MFFKNISTYYLTVAVSWEVTTTIPSGMLQREIASKSSYLPLECAFNGEKNTTILSGFKQNHKKERLYLFYKNNIIIRDHSSIPKLCICLCFCEQRISGFDLKTDFVVAVLIYLRVEPYLTRSVLPLRGFLERILFYSHSVSSRINSSLLSFFSLHEL